MATWLARRNMRVIPRFWHGLVAWPSTPTGDCIVRTTLTWPATIHSLILAAWRGINSKIFGSMSKFIYEKKTPYIYPRNAQECRLFCECSNLDSPNFAPGMLKKMRGLLRVCRSALCHFYPRNVKKVLLPFRIQRLELSNIYPRNVKLSN